ncbi:hypothetical protein BJV82DRAFT_178068 [Fennellomyces sp. T-0311]|nr:hypothetical protein BJV82DRAFT_178068 [Fennellomyces sp. T-0311]
MTKPTNELNNQAGIKRSRSGRSKQKRNPLKSILNDARPPTTMQQKQKTKEVASRKQSASSGYSSNCSSSGSEGESGGDEDHGWSLGRLFGEHWSKYATVSKFRSIIISSRNFAINFYRETLVLDQQEQVVFRKKSNTLWLPAEQFSGYQ